MDRKKVERQEIIEAEKGSEAREHRVPQACDIRGTNLSKDHILYS